MNNELKRILMAAVSGQSVGEFSAEDTNKAAINAIAKHLNLDLENITARELRRHRNDIFEIIEEIIDEALPKRMENVFGMFSEVKSIGRGDAAEFTLKTTHASKQRFKAALTRGARGGIYAARRLDGKTVTIPTATWTAAYMITLEELLAGTRTIAEGVGLIMEALEEQTYKLIFDQLNGMAFTSQIPSSHLGSGAFDKDEFDKLVKIARAYGTPTIFGFQDQLAKLESAIRGDMFPEADKDDYRNLGRVGVYKGTQVVEFPNFIIGYETNGDAKWAFEEGDIYIIGGQAKPVKVILRGEGYTSMVDQPHGGQEMHYHKQMGVGLIMANNMCRFTVTG